MGTVGLVGLDRKGESDGTLGAGGGADDTGSHGFVCILELHGCDRIVDVPEQGVFDRPLDHQSVLVFTRL